MFAVNVVVTDLPGPATMRREKRGEGRMRTVHTSACRFARRPRYRLEAAEVARLESRRTAGDDDGRTKFCAYCHPHRVAVLLTDTT